MNKKHIGSRFDDFLKDEGLLAEAEAVAGKRIIAMQITRLMKSRRITKSLMAKRMHTSRAAVERLLDPANKSVTLHTLERAAMAMGKQLHVAFIDGTHDFNDRVRQSAGR